jgi:glycosyltransferase involved in cell wall biosynthesis
MLVWNAHGHGGVPRTVLNLSNYLARDRQVEIISVKRAGRRPRYPIDESVTVTFLQNESPAALREALRRRKPSVVISSRPSLHQMAVRVADGRHVLIGQEHNNFETRTANLEIRTRLEEALDGLDAFTVLTESDAHDYRQLRPEARVRISVIRNALPFGVADSAPSLTNPVIIAAGRLVPEKGFDRLIEAFAVVAPDHPDWELHICGIGPAEEDLRRLGDERGLGDRLRLLGHVDDLDSRMRSAALFAMASKYEGFAMVLIEAMSQGLPGVAYDCPRGPREVIRNGVTGFLVPDGDHEAYVAAMSELVEDLELRRRMGAAALGQSAEYTVERVGGQWEALIDELVRDHNQRIRGR